MNNERVNPNRQREFFNPRNIALVGASDHSFWSQNTFSNLKDIGFPGNIYCVNPNREVVHAQRAYSSLSDIEAPVDLAYVMVSAPRVLDVLKEAASLNIRNFILLSAGYSESGEEGRRREEELLQFAREHDLLILGPNGMGFINVSGQVSAYSSRTSLRRKKGNIGFLLQSGQIADGIITLANSQDIGISFLASIGNEMMLSATDMIDYLLDDESTDVIGLFLESVRRPDEFKRVADKALRHGKPIVVFKIGRSEESAQTAMAHTGALVGDDRVNDAAFRQLGVVRVNSIEDLLITSNLLGTVRSLNGRRMGVVSLSGGACAVLADRAKDEKLTLPEFHPETVKKLEDMLPEFSSVYNPLDVTGYVVLDAALQARALEAVSEDPNVDFVVCIPGKWPAEGSSDPTGSLERFRHLSKIIEQSTKPIIPMMEIAVEVPPVGRKINEEFQLRFVSGLEHGMTAIGHAVRWNQKRREYFSRNQSSGANSNQVGKVESELEKAGTWPEYKAREFLQKHGVPVVPGKLAKNELEAANIAEEIGFPVALKIQSEDITHKSDIGGVELGLHNTKEIIEAFRKMMDNVKKQSPDSRLDGILISPMRPEGIEMLVGVVKDPLWGCVMAVGFGGIFVEVLKDTSLGILPLDRKEIKRMLTELRGYPLLLGARGKEPVNVERLTDVIYNLTRIVKEHAENLQELEINPLWLRGNKVEALDALITWKKGSPPRCHTFKN